MKIFIMDRLVGAVSFLLFLLQKICYPTRRPLAPRCRRILNFVAAIFILLPALGGVPKFAPQALGAVLQATVYKGFRCCRDLFL